MIEIFFISLGLRVFNATIAFVFVIFSVEYSLHRFFYFTLYSINNLDWIWWVFLKLSQIKRKFQPILFVMNKVLCTRLITLILWFFSLNILCMRRVCMGLWAVTCGPCYLCNDFYSVVFQPKYSVYEKSLYRALSGNQRAMLLV